MTDACDLLVIGGGPAGVEAALAGSGAGLRVVLVDETALDRAPARRSRPAVSRDADLRRAKLAGSRVEAAFGSVVWSVSPGFRIDALGPNGARSWAARAVIAATGAQERIVPFPGWTEPGVTGLAGAEDLPSRRGLPGRRTLVAGCGPSLIAVAAELLRAGERVVAVVDLLSLSDWTARLPALAARPDLLARRAGSWVRVMRAGVPILPRQALLRVEPRAGGGLRARVRPVDARRRPLDGPERSFDVDAVAVGHGLTPSTDVTRLLRAEHLFDGPRGGWIARRDRDGRTSIAGLSVAGDCGGIAGPAAAALDGRLAGLAVARDLGALEPEAHDALARPLRRQAGRARRFGEAMAETMALHPGQIDAIPKGTAVCRCEGVTRAEIEAAMAHGATTANQLKAWTRCGMGSCQGRACGDIAGALLARASGRHDDVGMFTGRTPFRPLSLDVLVGDCAYTDIALPPPAPL